ncbi:diguanylate cyclase [Sphingomonas ginsenosidivorax]|uniref:Diguanylate cyclase n=1 Tax=Sphingomonas ginsenosidivorax TaxID=862135 RepID=A0A5C6UEB7_9SPHN|nr:diguanylate cyclase [Sphingomonas ginsenosidivorax]TXC70466.1 diguanylate cyclase [Sphingomonas ginsenosidivorax]
MKAPARTTLRDLPDGTYIELVASLCGTRTPAVIMTVMFLTVGLLTVRASHDGLLACLTGMGAVASAARLAVLIQGRRRPDTADMSLAVARRFERRFALTYWAFAAVFGMFAARVFALPLAEWQMPMGILVVGYAAGAASMIALRPRILVVSLLLAVAPPSGVLLFRDDAGAFVSALILLALLAGGLRSVAQQYRSQSVKTTTRQASARQAMTDPLTGLGNRLALVRAFETHATYAAPGGIAFHYVDLDDFKPVNDRFGHLVGDRLLCLVADRLEACRHPGDVVVRLGGDEFVMVQVDASRDGDVERQTAAIAQALNGPYAIDGVSVVVGASVGSSRYAGPGQTMEALLAAADDALRQDKAARKGHGRHRGAGVDPAVAAGLDAGPRVSDALQDEEARARFLIDGIAKAIWESAPDGLIETDSPSWRAYTGQSYDDWKGYGWLTAIHPDDRLATVQKWRDTVQGQQSVDAEYRLRGHDGTYRWMGVHAVPLRDDSGRIVKWFGINIDIEDRKQAELAGFATADGAPMLKIASG